jgi:type VI secretion system secreted protein VgrG
MALKQQSRIGELKIPSLEKDKLVLCRFNGAEGLSELFTYTIEALSETKDIDFDEALGSKCTVSIKIFDRTRHFNGVLVEAQWIGERKPDFVYRLVLRPWLWLKSRESDCRIFANMDASEIIMKVLTEGGLGTVNKRLTDNYNKIEYYVQYRETNLNFVTRVMEEFGIYYFFEHQDGEHTLILADSKSSHLPVPGGETIPYHPLLAKAARQEEHLTHWVPGRRFNTGKVELNDYDYFKPSADMLSRHESASSYQNSKLEVYDYPGRYVETNDGDKLAQVRLEAEQATDRRCQAEGFAVSLCPGAKVTLKEHPTQNKEYLIVRAMHSLSTELFRSGSAPAEEEAYSGRYEFLPSDTPFRSPLLTPRPVVRGPQTAKVVGDGEIDVDKHGRIKVQFHWDRNEDESRRVRIGQVWSGKKWGGIFIPRVGMEVIVEFLEGDPDQPLVVGTVYNDEYKPPYDLPGDKNIAGWKSESTEGGGGYNEFIFDDTKGSELIRIHAEKDRKTHVKNDHDEYIGNKMTVEAKLEMKLIVGQSSIVMKPESITIKSPKITIKADMILDASSPKTTVTGDVTLTLKGGMVLIN